MNSKQEELARSQAKKVIHEAQKLQAEHTKNVTDIFRGKNCKDFFENTVTIVRDYNAFTSSKVDFGYYKLNLDVLKSLGITLEFIESNISVSSASTEMSSAEYYCDKEHSCIIFVIYRFKHVKLQSENNKTNLNTFVFVNSDCEVYYYDEYSDVKLLTSFATGMKVCDIQEIFNQKQFPVSPIGNGRTYQITSDENPDIFIEEKMVNLHLIPKQLLDIYFKNYEGKNVPSKSEMEIQCNFLGTTEKPVTVQTTVPSSYRYTGTVELSERMENYEIIMYFPRNPSQKLRAKFSLAESEKNGFLILTKTMLEQAVLESSTQKSFNDKKFFEKSDYLYDQQFVSKAPRKKSPTSVHANIAQLIRAHSTIKHNVFELPALKDTFQKVYIEHSEINVNDIPKEYSFMQLAPTTIKYEEAALVQDCYYSIIYNGMLYLVKVSSEYSAFVYRDPQFIIHLPALAICSDIITVFKPSKPEEVDSFSDGILKRKGCEWHYTWKLQEYEENYSINSRKMLFNKLFPDFTITSPESICRTDYRIVNQSNDTIYKGILNCIQNPETITTIFRYSYPTSFGGPSDEEPPKKRISISSNNIEYGFYFENECERKVVNCSFTDSDPNIISNGNDLLTIQFEEDDRFFNTTLHALIHNALSFSYREAEIITAKQQFKYSELWNLCVEFLFEKQAEIFSA